MNTEILRKERELLENYRAAGEIAKERISFIARQAAQAMAILIETRGYHGIHKM